MANNSAFTRTRPQIPSAPPGKGHGVAKPKKPHVTPEGRERLSQLAKERHARGDFKDMPHPGRPKGSGTSPAAKAKRVAKRVAEAALEEENAQQIIDVFKDGVHPNQPYSIRLKAAEAWLRVEGEEAKLTLKEEIEAGHKRDRNELLQILSEKLTSGHASALIRKQIESQSGVVDAEVVED